MILKIKIFTTGTGKLRVSKNKICVIDLIYVEVTVLADTAWNNSN